MGVFPNELSPVCCVISEGFTNSQGDFSQFSFMIWIFYNYTPPFLCFHSQNLRIHRSRIAAGNTGSCFILGNTEDLLNTLKSFWKPYLQQTASGFGNFNCVVKEIFLFFLRSSEGSELMFLRIEIWNVILRIGNPLLYANLNGIELYSCNKHTF